MFFKKSRIERDIDGFKAMQDKGLRVAKREDPVDGQEAATGNSGAERNALKPNEQTIDGTSAAPASAANERPQSMVGANAVWRGKLRTEGSARIEGEISGEVEAGETVFIEKGAKVRANIQARRVIIGGDLEGQIVCREQLVVQSSGRLGGEISTKTLVIEEGAIVDGQIQMLRDDEPARVSAKKTNNVPSRRDSVASDAIEATKG